MGRRGRVRAAHAPTPVRGGTAARPRGPHIARCGLPAPFIDCSMRLPVMSPGGGPADPAVGRACTCVCSEERSDPCDLVSHG
eukprot:356015-Chlamydomonas_euryale.AAC.1